MFLRIGVLFIKQKHINHINQFRTFESGKSLLVLVSWIAKLKFTAKGIIIDDMSDKQNLLTRA